MYPSIQRGCPSAALLQRMQARHPFPAERLIGCFTVQKRIFCKKENTK